MIERWIVTDISNWKENLILQFKIIAEHIEKCDISLDDRNNDHQS